MKSKKANGIIKSFAYGLTFLFGIFVIVVSTRVGRYNDSLLNMNFFVVLSDSMRPQFKANDLIVTTKRDATSIQVGDVITYYSRDNSSFGEIITHQVIEKFHLGDSIEFQTKGLNNDSIDPYRVLDEDIIGVYLFHVPDLGNFLFFTRTTPGYITIILIPFTTLFGLEIIEIRKKIRSTRAEELTQIFKLLNIKANSDEAKKLSKTDMSIEDVRKLIEINKKS